MSNAGVQPTDDVARWFELGVAALPLPGETTSGDLQLVQPFPGGALIGAVDALGHGDEAARAATLAVETLSAFAHEPLPVLLQRCHQALIGTRGVVLSLAKFDWAERNMKWLGVGDVEGVLFFADPLLQPSTTVLVTRGGIVGGRLPPSRPWVIPISTGDTLVFATDGVRMGYATQVSAIDPPQHIAEQILARFGKGTDDALVLVARYTGPRTAAR
jgi:hypothetical protein